MVATIWIEINRSRTNVECTPEQPLLWVLRDVLGLTGTKYGCGIGLCGACTVHVDGVATRSCTTPMSAVRDRSVTTIEGLGIGALHPLQRAWIDESVSECGYCQSGQIMCAAALLERTPEPTDDEITSAMDGNICRCGTYQRIRSAIHLAAKSSRRGR